LHRLLAAKKQELPGQVGRPPGGLLDLAGALQLP
jgi:hypothetical protein